MNCQLNNLSDYELLLLIKNGNREAFSEIYQRYYSVLYVYAGKFSSDADEIEDVIQDVFLSFWLKSGELELNHSLAAYLYSCVRYRIFDLLDKLQVRDRHLASLEDFIQNYQRLPDALIIEKQLQSEIESAISSLPIKMRNVFELSRNQGLSQKQIAQYLNISDRTVKNQVSNALKLLRLKLETLMSISIFF